MSYLYSCTGNEAAALLRGINVEYVIELKRQGLSLGRISELSGHDPKTIRKYVLSPTTPVYGPRARRVCVLDEYKALVNAELKRGVWNVTVLFRTLKQSGYTGSYTSLKNYVRPLRAESGQIAVRRFETEIGRQGQVDWGDLGDLINPDGTKRSISTFALVLGHSRAMFSEVTLDQKLPTLLRMHEAAFAQLGGVPQEILYDQMKTVVLRTLTLGMDDRGEIRWNQTFLDFARYWGFTPRLCHAYRPETKGKIEAGIKYIRRNFLCGRVASDLADLSGQMHCWLRETANARIHGTTHRVVSEALLEEIPHLQPTGTRPPYPLQEEEIRTVTRDAYVAFRTNRYAAPWQLAGREVCVRVVGEQIQLRCDNQIVITHALCKDKHQTIDVKALHAGMPYVDARTRGKTMITVTPGGPTVEQRSLDVYAEASECDNDECAA